MNLSVSDGLRQIRVFLVDGSPSGIITAEVVNWTGKVLAGPRARLAQLIAREEAGRTGIYLLIGPDPDRAMGRRVYIGEADSIRARVRRHEASEEIDFFERIAFVVSKDENLTKAHARFLESHILQLIKAAGAVTLANGTEPQFSGLPEGDRSDMTFFIDQLQKVLPLLGFDVFRSPEHSTASSQPEASIIFGLSAGGAVASAREGDDGFVVIAGSTARQGGTASFPRGYRALRDQLVADGKLLNAPEAGTYQFAVDVALPSPSAAAAIILGRSASGPQEWTVRGTGQTYRDWRSGQLSEGADTAPGLLPAPRS